MDLSRRFEQGDILVVGGAGYIGSHMVKRLSASTYRPIVFDNLSSGHSDAVGGCELIVGDLADRAQLNRVFVQYNIVAVMHFASCIEVGASIGDPAKYYRNNVVNTLNLLDAMRAHGAHRIIFSSSAAVYGNPTRTPIDESHPRAPVNPYGRTKWMVEEILRDYGNAYGLHSVSLRYFNAAGADPDGSLSERHRPETHLIPLALAVANGERAAVEIYGDDYPTADGSCVRDYIHVNDLCDAHWRALHWASGGAHAFNLGNGYGFSVREVIRAVEQVTQRRIVVNIAPRRSGDPPILVADAGRAWRELGWRPRYSQLTTIVEHAWQSLQRSRACAATPTERNEYAL